MFSYIFYCSFCFSYPSAPLRMNQKIPIAIGTEIDTQPDFGKQLCWTFVLLWLRKRNFTVKLIVVSFAKYYSYSFVFFLLSKSPAMYLYKDI